MLALLKCLMAISAFKKNVLLVCFCLLVCQSFLSTRRFNGPVQDWANVCLQKLFQVKFLQILNSYGKSYKNRQVICFFSIEDIGKLYVVKFIHVSVKSL